MKMEVALGNTTPLPVAQVRIVGDDGSNTGANLHALGDCQLAVAPHLVCQSSVSNVILMHEDMNKTHPDPCTSEA